MRVVLANRESVLLDQVLPPGCFYHTPRGITIHVFSEGEGGVRDRGGVGTFAVQEIFLDGVSIVLRRLMIIIILTTIQFESESKRQWIFDTLTSGKLVPV